MWFGTALGLDRFDGYSVKSFFSDPNDSTSLPGDGIYRIAETPDGAMVVMTFGGLALYHPETESFERHPEHFFKKYGTSAELRDITRDVDGSFWFVERYRLVRYHPKDDALVVVKNFGSDPSSIVAEEITDFSIDKNGNHWVVHSNGIAENIEVNDNQARVVQRISALYERDTSVKADYKIIADSDGDLWFMASGRHEGVFLYRTKEDTLEPVNKTSPLRLNTNSVSCFLEDNHGKIWIGVDHGGINVVDKRRNVVSYILHRDGDETSLSANSISHLYMDDEEIIWAGAYRRGISYYHPDLYQFDIYKRYSLDPTSLPFEDVNRFEEDRNGNLWIGTNGGGLIYFDRQTGKFRQYVHDPGNVNSLSGNVIVSLCLDRDDNLWIGTYQEGLNRFDGNKFIRYRNIPGDTTSLPSQNVWEIFEDSKKRLWIGTLDAGVAILDKKNGKFHNLSTWAPHALRSGSIEEINEDRFGNIWFGTIAGIDVLSQDGKTSVHYQSSPAKNSLSSNNIFDIMRDSRGRMWVATFDGLNLFDESIKGFTVFKPSRTGNAIMAIQEDNVGNIWMSTMRGLINMSMDNASERVSYKRYTEADGLQGRQFNANATYKTKKGELIFGGPTGFNIFKGTEGKKHHQVNEVVFSELELYEEPVEIGQEVDGVVILPKSVSKVDQIVLPPAKNFFSITFSPLNYFNPERDAYLYKLEGLNNDWLRVGEKSREIVFNNLNPGTYKLRLRAVNSEGSIGKNDTTLSIVILPPFWKTRTAFVLYSILLAAILWIARKTVGQREKLKFSIDQERREMQRMHELDLLKVKFFTNISHEFRTPLTLILTPIEKLLKRASDPQQAQQFQLIQRNGKRLMNLVNQLLDFKKLEVHEIGFNPTTGDVIEFVKETVMSFSDLAEKKSINLQFVSSIGQLETSFDHDKLEKILFNLLSNAFKFTLENGVVTVNIDILKEESEDRLQITVSDTGIGIPQDKLESIFEPFFQNDLPKNIINSGSGIGLAITKEFVRIHGGNVSVESEVTKGTRFKIVLPLLYRDDTKTTNNVRQIEQRKDQVQHENEMRRETAFTEEPGKDEKPKKKSLLIVEDSDDFRFYLKDNLKFSYDIHQAANGVEGWNMILSVQPDLIVSDIMMPEMTGIELCSRIKADERVSHIPVILLTAQNTEAQHIEGFQAGAADYITKPFNFEVLEARINNLLKQREKSQRQFRKTLDFKASELQITPLDVQFVERAVKTVEANIAVPHFSVEDLGMELGISRAYVFKKILALTGKTPLEFMRSIRLQHAAQLLERSQLSVQEVAYKVGFNNPKYFTKYFKEQYGVLPSEYLSGKRKDEQ